MRSTIIWLALAITAIAGHALARQQERALRSCLETHTADTCHYALNR